MVSTLSEILRGSASLALFALFGIGALLLSPCMSLFGRAERCHPLVCGTWRILVWLFEVLGLIRVDRGNLTNLRGTILVANHPSLIDVVLLTVLMPRTFSVSKPALRRNPFMGAIVRAVTVSGGVESLPRLESFLASGWNVLIFPEGTRSPARGLHPLHRGAAQLALRTGAPLACLGIRPSERILAKGQPVWRIGARRVVYRFRAGPAAPVACRDGESFHAAACRVTDEIAHTLGELSA